MVMYVAGERQGLLGGRLKAKAPPRAPGQGQAISVSDLKFKL